MTVEDALVKYAPNIEAIAAKLVRMVSGTILDFDDLLQIGRIALFKALKTLETAKDSRAQTSYINTRIHGTMVDEIRKVQFLPRTAHERGVHIDMYHLEMPLTFDDYNESDKPMTLQDTIAAPEQEYIDYPDFEGVARRTLSSKEYEVFIHYYFHFYTLKKIGKLYDVTESRISQILKAAKTKMAKALSEEGYDFDSVTKGSSSHHVV